MHREFTDHSHTQDKAWPKELNWVVDGLKEQGVNFPKTIIYCSSITKVQKMYRWLHQSLGIYAFRDQTKVFSNRLIDMFHSGASKNTRERLLDGFCCAGGNVRVQITTIALSLGVQIPDVRIIIHWMHLESVLTYWQEIGRAGRDQKPATSITYVPENGAGVSAEMQMLVESDGSCIRENVLQSFLGHYLGRQPGMCECYCCSVCYTKCRCQSRDLLHITKFG